MPYVRRIVVRANAEARIHLSKFADMPVKTDKCCAAEIKRSFPHVHQSVFMEVLNHRKCCSKSFAVTGR